MGGGDTLEEDESLEDEDNLEDEVENSLEDEEEESLDADMKDERLINMKTRIIFLICIVNMSLSSIKSLPSPAYRCSLNEILDMIMQWCILVILVILVCYLVITICHKFPMLVRSLHVYCILECRHQPDHNLGTTGSFFVIILHYM